jgi:hypothetical protein
LGINRTNPIDKYLGVSSDTFRKEIHDLVAEQLLPEGLVEVERVKNGFAPDIQLERAHRSHLALFLCLKRIGWSRLS